MDDRAPMGWYRQGGVDRYWDGSAWVDPSARAESAPVRREPGPWLMFGGAAAVAVGCFLPWVKASAPLMGSLTVSGVDDGGDGTIFLVIAAILAALVYRARTAPSRRTQGLALVLLVVMAGLLLYEIGDVAARFDAAEASSDLISTSYGSGLVLLGVGILAAFAGWLQMDWSA